MSDKEVTTKLTLQGDAGGMIGAMEKAKASVSGAATSMQQGIGGITSAFGGMMGIVSTVTAVLGGGKLLHDAIETTKTVSSEIIKLKNSLGISAEEASMMRVALDDVFLSADDMAAASGRVTKQLVKNEDAFKALGVTTRDSNGHFRSTVDIMTETNSRLMQFKEGTDRNVEGIKIYGKGWDEARKTLKLTSEAMEEGRKRAAELHIVMGEDALYSIKNYKLAMKDLEDVHESFKVQIGTKVIPPLTQVAILFGEIGVKAGDVLADQLSAWPETIGVMIDDVKNRMSSFKLEISHFQGNDGLSDREYLMKQAAIKALYSEGNNFGSDDHLVNMARRAKNSIRGSGSETSEGGQKAESDWTAAHNKYLEYEKAFYDRRAGIVRIANDAALEVNRISYEHNLVDLRTYLDTKNALTEESAYAEVSARKKTRDDAVLALSQLKPVSDSKGKGNLSKDAENYHAALLKVEQAQIAVNEAESKFQLLKLKNPDEAEKEIFADETRLATLAGNRREAERVDLDKSREFIAMKASMTGDHLTGELDQIEREKRGWIDSWATKVGSYEEYQQRLLEIETIFGQRRANASILNEQRIAQTKLTINQNYLNGFTALANAVNTIAGGKNKVLYALTQAAAIAVTFLSTEAAAAAALAPPPLGLGPIVGAPLAASIKISGYASMAAMAATTIANVAGIGSGSTPSTGSGGGTYNSPMVTQPVNSTASQPFTVTFAPVFHGPTDQQALTRWTEDYMIPTLRDLQTRGVTA